MASKMSVQAAVLLKQKIFQMNKAKKYGAALAGAKSLVESFPHDIEGWWIYAQLLKDLGRNEDAVRALYQVCQGPSPYYVKAIELAAKLAIDSSLWELAIAPARELLKVKDKASDANYLIGSAMFGLRRYPAAIQFFRNVGPDSAHYHHARYQIGHSSVLVGLVEQALPCYEESLATRADCHVAWQDYLMILNYSARLGAEYIAGKHREFGVLVTSGPLSLKTVSPFNFLRKIEKEKIVVGFVSADLRAHSVSAFLLPILKNLSLVDWEVRLYADVEKPDATSDDMRKLDLTWIDMVGYSSEKFVEKVRSDGVDILFDLMGYSSFCRLREFAQRMAPIQVTYLGYPNTTGLPAMDYRLTDAQVDPESEENQALYVEKLVHLPKTFLCFESLVEGDLELSYKEKEGVVFASFNSSSKYTDRMLDNWAEVLRQVPGSKLLLKTKPLIDSDVVELLTTRFTERGIEADRLELLGWTDTQADHLALYGRVDVHLDTFPYNGTTTTCEALWQGVPTVTLVGGDHRSRVGFSILSQLSMDECIAKTDAEFVEKAVALSNDSTYLKEFKAQARDKMRASPLMDAETFVLDFDRALRAMVDEYNRGL